MRVRLKTLDVPDGVFVELGRRFGSGEKATRAMLRDYLTASVHADIAALVDEHERHVTPELPFADEVRP